MNVEDVLSNTCPVCSAVPTYLNKERNRRVCSNCGCTLQDRGECKAISDQTTENYSQSRTGSLVQRFYPAKSKWFLRAVDNYLASNPPRQTVKVLDLGCGEGVVTRLLRDELAQLTGCRNSQLEMVGVDLRAPFSSDCREIIFYRGSILDANGPWCLPEEYDIVLMLDFVEHVLDQESLFDLVSKVQKQDGILVVETGDASHWYARLTGYNYYYTALADHVIVHSVKSLQMIAERYGYTLLGARRWYHRKVGIREYTVNLLKSMAHLLILEMSRLTKIPLDYFPKGYGLMDHSIVIMRKMR